MSRVCVIGNLTTDLILRDVVGLPGWGEETQGSSHASVAAGQGAYLALGLARLGIPTSLIGAVGADPEGAIIRSQLEAGNVDVSAVEIASDLPTAITVALVRPDGERAFISDFACQRVVDAALVERHWDRVQESTVLCLVGLFNLPTLEPSAALPLFSRARQMGIRTLLDTGWDPGQWTDATVAATRRLLHETDVFLPNIDEAAALTGTRDPAAAARELQGDGAAVVVVKCGADGSVGRSAGEMEQVAAVPVDVYDAVGAGDSFDAGFLYAHLQGWTLRDCMTFASTTAAIYVSRSQVRYPNVDEVSSVLRGTGFPERQRVHDPNPSAPQMRQAST